MGTNDKEQVHKKSPQDEDESSARSRLIASAKKLFAEKGLEGTSTRDIAKDSGLNISLISYYFGGKEGLYKALLSDFVENIKREFSVITKATDLENIDKDRFLSLMRKIIQSTLDFKIQHQDIETIVEREIMSGTSFSVGIFEELFKEIVEKIVNLYIQGQNKKFIRADINAHIWVMTMIHAPNQYLRMREKNKIMKKRICPLPEMNEDYANQLYLIFAEGALS